MTPKRLVEILSSRGTRGAIFEHFSTHDVSLEIEQTGIAAVALAHTIKRPRLKRIAIEQIYRGEFNVQKNERNDGRRQITVRPWV